MESYRICSLFVIVFCLQFRGYCAGGGGNCSVSLYTWPLGEDLVCYEVRTNSSSGYHQNIRYNTGPTFLGYNAVEFNASEGSFIEFPVPDFSAKAMDYSLSFFLYVESDGVFLHYRSDDYMDGAGTERIQSIKFEMISGSVQATVVTNNGEAQATANTNLVNNTWLPIVFRRDYSKQKITFHVTDGVEDSVTTGVSIGGDDTSFPGKLRFGGSIDGESHFSGRMACVQMMPCKDPALNDSYTAECAKVMSLLKTSTSDPLLLAVPASSLNNCKRYKLVHPDFKFSAGEDLDTFTLNNTLHACSEKCSTHDSCWSFVYKTIDGSCLLGPRSPGKVAETGNDLYEVVPYV